MNGLDLGCGQNRRIKDDSQAFVLSNWLNNSMLNALGKARGEMV